MITSRRIQNAVNHIDRVIGFGISVLQVGTTSHRECDDAEPKNAPDLSIGRFRRSKSPGGNRLILLVDTNKLAGLRDRSFIGIMLYAFGRVEAVLGMDCDQYYVEGRRDWVRPLEKGNKVVTMPCHHKLEEYLDEYVKVAGLSDLPKKVPLFQTTSGRSGKLTGRHMSAVDAWRIWCARGQRLWGFRVKLEITLSGLPGLPNYLQNGGKLGQHSRWLDMSPHGLRGSMTAVMMN